MEQKEAAELLDALGHEGRLSVYRLLVRRGPQGARPTEMATSLGLKQNTLSVYLAALESVGLIDARREGRAIHYSARMTHMGALVEYLVSDCCRGRPDLCLPQASQFRSKEKEMTNTPYNVLFICTGNSARSIFAEALLRDLGGPTFNVFSAGTRPFSTLNPFAVDLLQRNGHDITSLRAKNIAEFQDANAPQMDFVFTVCDAAANEDCPPWQGQPISAHWGLPDPVKREGTHAEKALAFAQTYAQMRQRVQAFAALPIDQLDRLSLQTRLDDIGRMNSAEPA